MAESQGPPTSGGAGEAQGGPAQGVPQAQPEPAAQPVTPAGWYPHPTAPGWEAYWDGAAWGAETRQAQAAAPAAPVASEQVPEAQPVYADQAAVAPQAEPTTTQHHVDERPTAQYPAVDPDPAVPASQPPGAAVAPGTAATAGPAAGVATSERSENSLPVLLCVLGALVAVVGSFLPAASSDVFVDIADNTMVAAGYGIAVIAAAVLGAAIAVYCYLKGVKTWLPILLGVVIAGLAVYAGTAGIDITPEFVTENVGKKAADDGSPSTGIFAVGIGGLLMILGGIGIARRSG